MKRTWRVSSFYLLVTISIKAEATSRVRSICGRLPPLDRAPFQTYFNVKNIDGVHYPSLQWLSVVHFEHVYKFPAVICRRPQFSQPQDEGRREKREKKRDIWLPRTNNKTGVHIHRVLPISQRQQRTGKKGKASGVSLGLVLHPREQDVAYHLQRLEVNPVACVILYSIWYALEFLFFSFVY